MPDSLEQIAAEVAVCTRCPLHRGRTKAVPGEGSPNADIMFIGEGPGYHEDRQGRPFVGASGSFLTEMLEGIGLRREDVFIANVVKCRPPGNRDPEPHEIQACSVYLDRQIALIDPKVIVTLGRFSMAKWFPTARISRIHGQARKVNGRLIVPFFHPAAALHQPTLRQAVEEDFRKLPGYVAQALAEREPDTTEEDDSPGETFEQLSLF
ncbi:MAG TPA: uracil-DNA glycosylase [Aggregatilineales bacterium]|nr:uracil-DNA glycosylase [Aggregatilineales bacterium]HQA67033.1 uracil-DNA glycosylase [Aggregatilineales bacterium]